MVSKNMSTYGSLSDSKHEEKDTLNVGEINHIIDKYFHRQKCEEIDLIEAHGGIV